MIVYNHFGDLLKVQQSALGHTCFLGLHATSQRTTKKPCKKMPQALLTISALHGSVRLNCTMPKIKLKQF